MNSVGLVKKILSATLALVMVLCACPMTAVRSFADGIVTTKYLTYQAEMYASDEVGFDNIFVGTDSSSYARTFLKALQNDSKFVTAVAEWEGLHIASSPSYTLESGMIQKSKFYEAVLFDMFDVTDKSSFQYLLGKDYEKVFKALHNSTNSYVIGVAKSILAQDSITKDELNTVSYMNLSDSAKDLLLKGTRYAGNANMVASVNEIIGGVKSIADVIKTVGDYLALKEYHDGAKEILDCIANDSRNDNALRDAAKNIAQYFDESFNATAGAVIQGTVSGFKTCIGMLIDKAWGKLVSSIPGGKAVLLGAKGMRVLGNALFSQDKKIEGYYMLDASVKMEDAFIRALEIQKQNLKSDSVTYAPTYMQGISLYKNVILLGFGYSTDMLETAANSSFSTATDFWFGNYTECTALINEVNTFKNQKINNYTKYEEMILNSYKEKYCPEYDELDATLGKSATPITSMTVSKIKNINLGDSGSIYDFFSFSYAPSTHTEIATEDGVTSSNENIIKVEKSLWVADKITAVGEGTCTLTFSSNLGKFTQSMEITVGNGSGTGSTTSDFKYSVLSDGTIEITGYIGKSEFVIIPRTIDGKTVTKIGEDAFYYKHNLQKVMIPNSVTEIGNYAFSYCSGLTSVKIPNSVTEIGNCAFSYCSGLTSVKIPDSVTEIGNYAFKGCTGLTSVTIPDSLAVISDSTFYGCTGLTSVMIPDSVTEIGSEAFYGCTGLTSVTIPDSVTEIGNYAFSGCTGLTSVTIPDYVLKNFWWIFKDCVHLSVKLSNNVTKIGSFAFSGCTGLTSVTIPDSVTEIGEQAFKSCTGLTSVTIPGSVKAMGIDAFEDCTGLTSVTILNGVTEIGMWAFGGCTGLTSVTIPDSVTEIGSSAFEGCTGLTSVTIPDSVTEICSEAFYGCTGLTSVTIPDSVTYIHHSAFEGCTALKEINVSEDNAVYKSADGVLFNKDMTKLVLCPQGKTGEYNIPNSVTEIDGFAFYGCTGLTSVTMPNGVTGIGYSAFGGCTGLTSVTIPDSVTVIDSITFEGCTGLTSVTISNSVTGIGYFAFRGCTALKEINVSEGNMAYTSADGVLFNKDMTELVLCPQGKTGEYNIPSGVTEIGHIAFGDCTGLTSVTIPDSVTEIGSSAFEGCTGLTSVTIPDSVTKIYFYAFRGCTGLASVTIPDSVTKICNDTFRGCTGLTSMTIPDSVTEIDFNAFRGCTGLTSVTIPDSVTEIGHIAFGDCTGLTSVTIPDSVTEIDCDTFYGCTGLTSVTIPDSVTYIDSYAFSGCTGLTSVTIPDSVTKIDNYAFRGCTGLMNITIPKSVTEIGDRALGYYDYNNKIDGFTISGYRDTAAEKYAEENSISFILIEDAPCEHKNTAVENAVDATCTTAGYTGDVRCLDCNEIITVGTAIHATGHKSEVIKGKSATCTQTGLTDGTKCSVCGITLIAQKNIPATGHKSEVIKGKSATCTQAGLTDGAKCSVCGITLIAQKNIPALGHKFENGKCTVCGAIDPNYKPTEPASDEPTTDKPTEPASDEPTTGKTEEPTTNKPSEPTTNKPSEPTTDKTAEPTTDKPTSPSGDKPTENPTDKPSEIPSTEPTTGEKLEFNNPENVNGKIDEENKKVSVTPNASAGISLDDFKAMFKGAVSVSGEKIDRVYNGMKFTFNGEEFTFILKGDTSPDGKITAKDARAMLRIAAKLDNPDEITREAADVDSDGKVTSKEARSVLRFTAKLQKKIYE